jgi:F-type H+-transporting ATPase subunit b
VLKRISAAATAGLAQACLAVEASEGGGGGGGQALITPQIGLFFWTLVTFLALLWALRKFAWKPLLGAIEGREKAIREAQEQARSEREEASALVEEQRKLLAEARRERAEAVEAGRKDADRLRAEILEEAKRQREQILKQTAAQVESGLKQAQSQLKEIAADLALQAAAKLLSTQLDDATHRRLVEEYLRDIERLPSGSSQS